MQEDDDGEMNKLEHNHTVFGNLNKGFCQLTSNQNYSTKRPKSHLIGYIHVCTPKVKGCFNVLQGNKGILI